MHEKAQRAHDVKWRRINVSATWWRRIDVDTTSFWHQMPTGPGWLTLHNLIRVYFSLDTLKDEKERLISLYKCAGKFEYWQYAHWLSFSMYQNPTPLLSISINIPSIRIPGAPVAQLVKRWPTDLADRVRSSLEVKSSQPTVNGVPLHTAFHYHLNIVLIWLKYCWKGRKIASHSSIGIPSKLLGTLIKEVHNVNHIVYWIDRPPFPVCVKTLLLEV